MIEEHSTALTTHIEQLTLDALVGAWLDAKQRKTGSAKTAKAYEDTLLQFRAALQRQGLDLDS